MGISFHCQRCKKKVKAPDSAGGKWGNCPHCTYKCYIPLPPDNDEPELCLAPIDDNEEKDYNTMMRETYKTSHKILHETASNDDDDDDAPVSEREIIKNIIIYLRMMADGRLDQAESMAAKIKPHGDAAKQLLKRMKRTERPEPELEDIPPKLLLGFMKNLAAVI